MPAQSPLPHASIHLVSCDPVSAFAAQELQHYLLEMTGVCLPVQKGMKYSESSAGIWLGQAQDLPQAALPRPDSDQDDAIWVDMDHGQGTIAGVNARSVLLAVYRFLTLSGCRWIRPGEDGEIIPRRDLLDLTVHAEEQPAYRHRGICIEGAVSLENVLEMVAWAPKVGLSGYFMQFREGYTFFDRWYAHTNNPTQPAVKISVDQAQAFTRQIEAELQKRGMAYHAVGHGWTCEAFGIPGLGWDPQPKDWPEEVLNSLALVNGKRAMWQDIPLVTSLCFSNLDVRARVVSCVVDYVQAHPNIQALHFWLDDGFNNKCECAECQKMRPSDYYVILLNELDDALTRLGYPGKIVFLSYADLLWPPEKEHIHNPDRFIMMFAPITRSYTRPLFPQDMNYTLPPYARNRLVFSNNNDEQLAFLRAWQTSFRGDSFIYDYHLCQSGSYIGDPDGLSLARLLNTDIKNLKRLGLNGMVSCQIHRFFFPTGLVMYTLGRTLWDDGLAFDDLLDEYLAAAFGEDWALCKEYLQSLSALQEVVSLREQGLPADPQAQAKLRQGGELIRQFAPVIERHLNLPDRCQARSWFYLKIHADLLQRCLGLFSARAEGNTAAVRQIWEEIKTLIRQQEAQVQPVLDVYAFIHAYDQYFAGEEALA